MCACFHDFGGAEREGERGGGDVFDGCAVEDFGLQEDAGVWGGDCAGEETGGLGGAAGDYHSETRNVCE